MSGENANSSTFLGSMTTSEDATSSHSSTLRRKKPATLAVACLQCRARKVRCDAGQPKCGHCTKRSQTCEYIERKIRGPDRQPGTRVRQFWKKPDAHIDAHNSKGVEHPNETIRIQAGSLPPEIPEGVLYIPAISPESHGDAFSSERSHLISTTFKSSLPSQAPSSNADESTAISVRTTYLESLGFNAAATLPSVDGLDYIPRGPSVAFSKDTWWDSLLDFYGQDHFQSSRKVYQDISFLFNNTVYWTSFINLPLFFEKLYDPVQRSSLQPSLVLSALAFSTLMQSSETNLGQSGRNRALLLRDAAQSSLEASLSAGWIETSLVQAALLLTIFEGSPHPYHSPDRTASALSLLDSLIYSLGLLLIDVHEPTVSIFPADEVPTVPSASAFLNGIETQFALQQQPQHNNSFGSSSMSGSSHEIHPREVPKAHEEPESPLQKSWRLMLKRPNWPDIQMQGKAEIEKEEVRRLCWNALSIATMCREHTPYFRRTPWNLHILKQENFAIFFPEEFQHRSDNNPEDIYSLYVKDTVWALHCRGMLLWNAYFKFKGYPDGDLRKAEISTRILREAVSIESSVARHTQSVGKRTFYLAGDFLFRIKALVSNLRDCCNLHPHMGNISHIGTFDSSSSMVNEGGSCSCAEMWRVERNHIVVGIRSLVGDILTSGSSAKMELELAKTPLSIWWTLSRIKGGVESWRSNPSFRFALEQSWDFIALADFVVAVWPSPAQKQYLLKFKGELIEACLAAGVSIPTSLPIPGLESYPNADITVTVPLYIPRPATSVPSSAEGISIPPVD